MIQSRIDQINILAPMENIGATLKILPILHDIFEHARILFHFNDKWKQNFIHPSSTKAYSNTLIITWKEVMEASILMCWNPNMVAANHAIRTKSNQLTTIL